MICKTQYHRKLYNASYSKFIANVIRTTAFRPLDPKRRLVSLCFGLKFRNCLWSIQDGGRANVPFSRFCSWKSHRRGLGDRCHDRRRPWEVCHKLNTDSKVRSQEIGLKRCFSGIIKTASETYLDSFRIFAWLSFQFGMPADITRVWACFVIQETREENRAVVLRCEKRLYDVWNLPNDHSVARSLTHACIRKHHTDV